MSMSHHVTDESLIPETEGDLCKHLFQVLPSQPYPSCPYIRQQVMQSWNLIASRKASILLMRSYTSFDDITRYNNFYELGLKKGDPKRNAHHLKVKPWAVKVEGECEKPGEYGLEDLILPSEHEERIYRLRCVEAWSMVIPWVGVELGGVLKRFHPTFKSEVCAVFYNI